MRPASLLASKLITTRGASSFFLHLFDGKRESRGGGFTYVEPIFGPPPNVDEAYLKM